MTDAEYRKFLDSHDTLRVYHRGCLLFSSARERLLPLLDYLDAAVAHPGGVTVFDRVTGNAAALLLCLIGCAEVRSPLGSRLAVDTLENHGIRYRFEKTVPCIMNNRGDGMCPMEKLSRGKTPPEFLAVLRQRTGRKPQEEQV